MCYHPSGHIIFSLRKLKFYWGQGPGAGGWGLNMRVKDRYEGRITQTPFSVILLRYFILDFPQIEFLFFIFFIFTKFSLERYFRYFISQSWSIHYSFSEFFCHKWSIISFHFLLSHWNMFIRNCFKKIRKITVRVSTVLKLTFIHC